MSKAKLGYDYFFTKTETNKYGGLLKKDIICRACVVQNEYFLKEKIKEIKSTEEKCEKQFGEEKMNTKINAEFK